MEVERIPPCDHSIRRIQVCDIPDVRKQADCRSPHGGEFPFSQPGIGLQMELQFLLCFVRVRCAGPLFLLPEKNGDAGEQRQNRRQLLHTSRINFYCRLGFSRPGCR